tara:strand:+ start:6041 stop:8053 length:2013 start_codon:yes stop_codon:yes gene_type:complete
MKLGNTVQLFKLTQNKIYLIGAATAVIPVCSGVLIGQAIEHFQASWALAASGSIIAVALSSTIFFTRYIKNTLSLDNIAATIDTLSIPLLIADRQNQLKYSNQSANKIEAVKACGDSKNIVALFHEAMSSELNTEKDASFSTHLLNNLVAPLHLNITLADKNYRALFKPITVCKIRMGTVVEFHEVAVEYIVSLPSEGTLAIQAEPLIEPEAQVVLPLQIEHIVECVQHAMLIVDEDNTIQFINESMICLLNISRDNTNSNKKLMQALGAQTEHLKAFLTQALQYEEKTEFLQDGSPTADWFVTPIMVDGMHKGYMIEAHTPSKQEVVSLKNNLEEVGRWAKTCEKEIAHFINLLGYIDLYQDKDKLSTTILDFKQYKHPLLKKGIKSVQRLADIVNQSTKETNAMRSHLAQQQTAPIMSSNQMSILSHALLRNLDELRRDYCSLKNHQAENSRIVNEQKGITQGLNQITEDGYSLTQACRGKVLSGFEMVTLIVQSMQQFESELSAMLKILEQTQGKIKKIEMAKDVSTTLELFMESLTGQIRQATQHCKKNKSRLNMLIPNYTTHHLQMGHLQTQWQNSLQLIQTQENTLSEWRGYQKQEETYQSTLEVRLEALYVLSEKIMRKSMGVDEKNDDQVNNISSGLHQFEDVILRSGLPQININEIAEKNN